MAHRDQITEFPPGSQYGVAPRRHPFGVYFFGNFEDTLHFVTVNNLVFCCEVVRVTDNAQVWPLPAKGGDA